MNKIEKIIVHCSDSNWGCTREIRNWHLQRGWKDIGYHFVILNGYQTSEDLTNNRQFIVLDGSIECGRYLNGDKFISNEEIGSHTIGYNANSVGICLIGKKDFTEKQKKSVQLLCLELIKTFDLTINDIMGHYETKSGALEGKTCPNIDMNNFRKTLEMEHEMIRR